MQPLEERVSAWSDLVGLWLTDEAAQSPTQIARITPKMCELRTPDGMLLRRLHKRGFADPDVAVCGDCRVAGLLIEQAHAFEQMREQEMEAARDRVGRYEGGVARWLDARERARIDAYIAAAGGAFRRLDGLAELSEAEVSGAIFVDELGRSIFEVVDYRSRRVLRVRGVAPPGPERRANLARLAHRPLIQAPNAARACELRDAIREILLEGEGWSERAATRGERYEDLMLERAEALWYRRWRTAIADRRAEGLDVVAADVLARRLPSE